MIKDLAKQCRSVRNFLPDEVKKETLEEIISIARFCPSSANLQALKFKIVYDEAECKKVFKNIRWAGYLKSGTVPEPGCHSRAYIIICNDNRISPRPLLIDTGIVAQSMMLYACEFNLGGCMIGSFNEVNIKKAFSLSDNYSINLILALGCPKETSVIVDVIDDSIKYFRVNGTHYVPKRSLEELLI